MHAARAQQITRAFEACFERNRCPGGHPQPGLLGARPMLGSLGRREACRPDRSQSSRAWATNTARVRLGPRRWRSL